MNKNREYLVKLTWLRGIAALFVVVSHSIRVAEGEYGGYATSKSYSLINAFDLGTFGVMLFFTLSGATLYFSNGKLTTPEIIPFYIKRFFRIWPAFVVSLIAYLAFRKIFQAYYTIENGNWVELQFLADYSMGDLLSYLTLTSNIFGPSGLFNNAFWSLPVEFQYYLLFPFLVFISFKVGISGPILTALLAYAVQKFELVHFESNNVFLLAYTFCFGFCTAYIYSRTTLRLSKVFALALFGLSTGLCALTNNSIIDLSGIPVLSNPYGYPGVFAVFAVSSLLFMKGDFKRGSIFTRPFYWLGEVSYSLYLYHNLLLGLLVILALNTNTPSILQYPWLNFIFALSTSCIVAKVSYEYVEKPFINIGKKLSAKKT